MNEFDIRISLDIGCTTSTLYAQQEYFLLIVHHFCFCLCYSLIQGKILWFYSLRVFSSFKNKRHSKRFLLVRISMSIRTLLSTIEECISFFLLLCLVGTYLFWKYFFVFSVFFICTFLYTICVFFCWCRSSSFTSMPDLFPISHNVGRYQLSLK